METESNRRIIEQLQHENAKLKRHNDELEQLNVLYRKIINKLPFGIQIFDSRGVSFAVNEKQKELLGLPNLQEGIGTFNVLTDPYAVSVGSDKVYKEVYKGKSIEHEFDYDFGAEENTWNTRKDKARLKETIFPVEKDDQVAFAVSVLQDVSEESLKQTELNQSEERFRSLFYDNLVPMFVLNIKTRKIEDANKAAENFYGYGRDEFLSMKIDDINTLPPEALREAMLKASKTKQIYFRFSHRLKNGTIKSVEVYSSIIRYRGKIQLVSMIHDISEKLEADKKLKEQQLLFETMFNTIAEGIVITDTNRKILLANKGMESTFGYLPEDIIGKKTQLFYADENKYTDAGKNVFNKESLKTDRRYLTYYKDRFGKVFPGETFGAKLYDDQGEWIGNIGVMRDVSERVRFIEDLKAAKEKAEQSDRLKTAFLENISHEIRTPMNAIVGFSDLLDKAQISDEKRSDFVRIIKKSSNQLLAVVSDILTISSIETGQEQVNLENFSLNKIFDELFQTYRGRASKSVSLRIENKLPKGRHEISADKTKLTHILDNLISNAFKFTHRGHVEFGCKLRPADNPNEILFVVKDTGIGIKPELHEAVFERFRQADKHTQADYGGTGLGLSISKAYAELMGGEMWLESEPGEGSAFFFSIPYRPAQEKIILPQTGPANRLSATVLVAEDDDFNFMYLEELLSDFNVKILHAKNGDEAIEFCRSNPEITLVLMDISMPITNGNTAAEIIKQDFPELLIIAQSAYALEHEISKYGGIFDDYITKPIDAELFADKMQGYLGTEISVS